MLQHKRNKFLWTLISGALVLLMVGLVSSLGMAQTTGTTSRVSVASNGTQANDRSVISCISANGQFVVFNSLASNLVDGDTNQTWDVFIHDRETGQTTLASIASDGTQANGSSGDCAISGDGEFIAFQSDATNLVQNDENGHSDVFLLERTTGVVTLVSSNQGVQGNGSVRGVFISTNGRYIAYSSVADNLVDGDTNQTEDIFIYDRVTDLLKGITADHILYNPHISDDGKVLVYQMSYRSGLRSRSFVQLYDLDTGVANTVSIDSNGQVCQSKNPDMSADGRFVVFETNCSLIETDINGKNDIYVYDSEAKESHLISFSSNGTPGDEDSDNASISPDGRFIGFESSANNLVEGIVNKGQSFFVHDRQTGETKFLYLANGGVMEDSSSSDMDLSTNGEYITFTSFSTNLVENDTNEVQDVFLHARDGGVSPTLTPTRSPEPNPSPSSTSSPTPTSIPSPCPNCTVKIQGKVLMWDGIDNNQPASDVEVRLIWQGRQKIVTTKNNGQYMVEVEPATYTIDATLNNHKIVSEMLNVDGVKENVGALVIDVQQDLAIPDMLAIPCISPATQLNICELKKGDILLEDVKSDWDTAADALYASYFLHAALYDDANVIEAAGPNKRANEEQGKLVEVRKIALQHNSLYTDNRLRDWVVIRVKDEYQHTIQGAVEYASAKAYDPSVRYLVDFWNVNNKKQEDAFYCSLLIWRAYSEQGLDLDFDIGYRELTSNLLDNQLFRINQAQVFPDNLYASASGIVGKTTLVQAKPGVSAYTRILLTMWSPAEMRITDALEGSAGYDVETGVMTSTIPGALYSQVGAEPKWIRALVSGTVTVDVYGTGAGEYSLLTHILSEGTDGNSFHHSTASGQHDTILLLPTNEQVEIVPVTVNHNLYLPIIQR